MNFDIKKVGSQKGRVAIVTGANIGLGFETTKALAQKGATVVMACRNAKKANMARESILKENPQADLHVLSLDLSQLSSVSSFVSVFLTQFNQLDLLINNAGIMIPPYSETVDGFESQMGTNYFSHFRLTGLLLDVLEKTKGSRIVTLSSIAHRQGKIHFDDMHFKKRYSSMGAYQQSKLACLMFSYELDRKLRKKNFQTISVAAHPGVSNTNLGHNIPAPVAFLLKPLWPIFAHTPDKGAQPSLLAALGTNVKGGDFFGPTGRKEMKGPAGKVGSYPQAQDQEAAKKLWDLSEDLTQTQYFK